MTIVIWKICDILFDINHAEFLVITFVLQDYHSPSTARRTRKQSESQETRVEGVTRGVARVSVSCDSPQKIVNMDSPSRPELSKEAVGNIVATFRRGLQL